MLHAAYACVQRLETGTNTSTADGDMCCSCKPQPANAFPSLTLQRHADVEWRVGLQRAEPYAQLAHQLDTAGEHGQQGSTHALAAASLVLTSQQSLCQQGKRTGRQADRYADRQGGVRSARQTPRQADRQASTSQAVLSTLHHHPPSAPTAKHGCYTYYNILWHGWQAVQVLQAGMWLRPNTTGAGGAAAHSSSSLHAYQRQHLVWLRQRQFEVPAPVVVLCRVAGTADKAVRAQQQHKEHIQCPAQTSTKHASSSPVLFGRAALPCSRLSRCPGVQHDLQMAQELATTAINMYVAARWTAARFSGPFNLPLCKCASPMHSVVTLCCHCDIIPLCVKCLDNKVQYSHRRRLLHTAANSTCCCCCCISRQLSSCCCARGWQGRITTCQTGR